MNGHIKERPFVILVALVVVILALSVSIATMGFSAEDGEALPEDGSKDAVSLMMRPDVSVPEVSVPSGQQTDEPDDPVREFLENSGDESSEPTVSEPAASEPTVSEPAVSEPAVPEPTVSEPDTSAPEPEEPDGETEEE